MKIDLMNIGDALMDEHYYSSAIKFYSKLIVEEPENSIAYLNRALCYVSIWNMDAALIDFASSLEYDNKNIDALINRGVLYLGSDNINLAIDDFLAVTYIDANHSEALGNLIQALIIKRRFSEALKYNERLSELLSFTDAMKYDTANIHFGLGNYQVCLSILLELIKAYPNNTEYLNYIGYCYVMLQDLDSAIKYFNLTLKFDPFESHSLNNLGYVYYLQSKDELAKKLILQSLEINPGNSYAYKNLGLIEQRHSNYQSAKLYYELSLEIGFTELWGNEVETLLDNLKSNG